MNALSPRDVALASCMIFLWGSNYAVAKLGLGQIPPFLFLSTRFALTAILLAPFIKWRIPPLQGIGVYAVIVGLAHFGTLFYALRHTDAATVIILSQVSVPLITILGAFLLGEKLRARHMLGIVIATSGLAVVAGSPGFAGGLGIVACILVSATAWAVGTVWMKAQVNLPSSEINFWLAALSAPMLYALSVLAGERPLEILPEIPPLSALTIFYQAFFTVIVGYGIWNFLVRKYEVNLVAPLTMLVPFTGILVAFLVLGESLSTPKIVGGCITMLGVVTILAPSSWAFRVFGERRKVS